MGIAVAIIYLPLYIVFSLVAVFAVKKIKKSPVGEEAAETKYRYHVIGLIVSTSLTWCLIWLAPAIGNDRYESFFIQLFLTLLIPIALGFLLFRLIKLVRVIPKWHFISFISGVFYSTIAIPWLTILAASNYYNVVNFSTYYSLCSSAAIEFVEEIYPAKSVFLSPDLFTSAPKGRQAETHSIGKALLYNSTLEYIERPSEPGSKHKFERMHTKSERILREEVGKGAEFVTQSIEMITSEYIVISNRISFPEEKKNGIGGNKIEVRRVSDNKLIAHAKYYWDNKTFKSCPSDAHNGSGFTYRFIATALNVINE